MNKLIPKLFVTLIILVIFECSNSSEDTIQKEMIALSRK